MAAWKYIKGGESDFEGAPEWATHRMFNCQGAGTANKDNQAFTNGAKEGSKWVCTIDKTLTNEIKKPDEWHLIAQRERVTSVNDDRLARYFSVDVVNHPSHYTQGGIECIDAIKAATVGKTGIEVVCVANVVKYLWRYEEKNGLEDVKKARWYLERLIQEMGE